MVLSYHKAQCFTPTRNVWAHCDHMTFLSISFYSELLNHSINLCCQNVSFSPHLSPTPPLQCRQTTAESVNSDPLTGFSIYTVKKTFCMGTGQLKALSSFLCAFPVPAASVLTQGYKFRNTSKIWSESSLTQRIES